MAQPSSIGLWQKIAENACNIASHLSIDRTHVKRGILRQARHIQAVLKQTCQRITEIIQVWSEKSFLSLVQVFCGCKQHGTAMYKLQVYIGNSCLKPDHKLRLYKHVLGSIHEVLTYNSYPAALVCPKTCDTVAEDACNIASHLSIDRTHDKRGILRQARYIEAVLKQTCYRITQVVQIVNWEVLSLSCPRVLWMQTWHSHECIREILFQTGS